MPKFKTLQTRFTQGELDPLMIGRSDVDQYYGAAALLRNVFTIPQGGVRRRPGLEYIGRVLGALTLTNPTGVTAPNGGTGSNASDGNAATTLATSTGISTTNPYVVVQYDFGSAVNIGKVHINGLSISSGTGEDFYLQVSTDASTWVSIGAAMSLTPTAKDFSRRVHGSYRYARLARIGATDLSTATVTLKDMLAYTESGVSAVKQVFFEFNVTQTYMMVFSDQNIAIYQNGVYLIDIHTTDYTQARLAQIDYVQSADTLIIFHPDVQTKRLVRGSANDVWAMSNVPWTNIPTYDFGSGSEAIWSSTRGWPRHGAFYQGRLYVDGGRSRPTVGYGSKVNSPYDFNFGTALDDEAVGPFGAQEFNSIEGFYPGRNLVVFTSGAEYILPQPLGDPITPKNLTVSRQTRIGSAEYLRPQETEGGILYIQRGGKSIQEFIYADTEAAYSNNLVSLLSSHLVTDPIDFSLRRATNTEDGAYLLMVLGDGSLTVVNVLRGQGVTAFTKQTTDGFFKSCGADVQDMYFVVERTINNTAVRYFERFNNSCYLDSSVFIDGVGSPTATFTGLSHLNGRECRVLADGAVMQNRTPLAGSVTIERNATQSFEIGLNFTPTIQDLPVENQQLGTVMGMPVNVSEIVLRLSNTAGILVNGKTVSFRGFGPSTGGSPLDTAPPRYTGVKKLYGWRGWTEGGQITITQTDPLPMTVLSLAKRVNV